MAYVELGVNEVDPREITDYGRNSYGDLFIDFLININCCVLNGRQGSKSKFAYVEPPHGCSVMDYCLVPHEQINESNDFKIHSATELMQSIDITINSNPEKSVSDHLLLTWNIKIKDVVCVAVDKPHQLIKYNTQSLPSDFFSSNVNKFAVNDVIERLENEVETQTIIDDSFAEFYNVIDNEKL